MDKKKLQYYFQLSHLQLYATYPVKKTPPALNTVDSYIESSKSLGLNSVQGHIYTINKTYPGFKRGNGMVVGELIEIITENLALIDYYEGDEYRRAKITTFNNADAWIYEYIPEVSKHSKIKSGDWLNRHSVIMGSI